MLQSRHLVLQALRFLSSNSWQSKYTTVDELHTTQLVTQTCLMFHSGIISMSFAQKYSLFHMATQGSGTEIYSDLITEILTSDKDCKLDQPSLAQCQLKACVEYNIILHKFTQKTMIELTKTKCNVAVHTHAYRQHGI